MGRVHVNQSALKITRILGTDITGATSVKLKYKKPSLEAGEWTAVIDDAATGTISYTIPDTTTIDQYGNWIIWGWVTFSTGKIAQGEASRMVVYKEGEL